MPKTSEMRESKFLKQSDVGAGALLTIASCEQHNVAMQGAEPELKWCLTFEETDKPLVLNSTNIQLCERALGSDDTDHWIGQQLVLYTDPNVSYGGRVVGGIRVRAPKRKPAVVAPRPVGPAPKRPAGPAADDAEDLTADGIPF